jgi:hypothetical protein
MRDISIDVAGMPIVRHAVQPIKSKIVLDCATSTHRQNALL